MKKILLILIAGCSFFAVQAQVPQTLTYQGFLTDGSGNPEQSPPDLVINIYDGVTSVYTATLNDVPISKGLFTVVLGKNEAGNPLIPVGIWNKPLKIGIKVNGGAELPLVSLTVVPYAFMASAVYDNAVSTAKISDGAVTGVKLATDAVTNAKLADNSVNTAEMVNNAVTTAKIADDAVTAAKLGTSGVTDANKIFATDASGNPQLLSALTTMNVDGFTKLGSDAPAIRLKKLTGTTGASEGFDIGVTHGISVSKLLVVIVSVESSTNQFIGPNYTINAEYLYSYYVTATEVRVVGAATNSGSILSKPIEITLIYEQ